MPPLRWSLLPTELRLFILQLLSLPDLVHSAVLDRATHALSIPAMYTDVHIASLQQLKEFVKRVPQQHTQHIRTLTVRTKPLDACASSIPEHDDGEQFGSTELKQLLSACDRLESLSLHLWGQPDSSLVEAFVHLSKLETLSISSAAPEEHLPISERWIVAIAHTLPNLRSLALSAIVRSLVHAPELLGASPFVPVIDDRADVYPSTEGTSLRLPTLLAHPSLEHLSLQHTHLGDALWATAPVHAPLATLELGSSAQETACASQAHTAALLANPGLGAHLTTLALDTALNAPLSPARSLRTPPPPPRFPQLSALRVGPYFPLFAPTTSAGASVTVEPSEEEEEEHSTLERTLAVLCPPGVGGCPLVSLTIHAFAADAPDFARALAGVLRRRTAAATAATTTAAAAATVQLGFLPELADVELTIVPEEPALDACECCAPPMVLPELDAHELEQAVRAVRDAARDVRLAGVLAFDGVHAASKPATAGGSKCTATETLDDPGCTYA